MPPSTNSNLLVISQTFAPDPAAVGQHMADVAVEMARRGHRVIVYTSERGYENPDIRYPKRETLSGVDVRRLRRASFGKKHITLRILGTMSFMLQAMYVCLTTKNVGGIFFSTSPPMIGVICCIAGWLRRVPVAYWAMDLNPDQLIALEKIRPRSAAAFVLERANQLILRRSTLVVALDRFMAHRLLARVPDLSRRMEVIPPWAHQPSPPPATEENPFRIAHALQSNDFIIMYSGNHSPSNPLRTLLDAAARFKDHPRLRFLFIGGGLGKREVEDFRREQGCNNIVSLPYQPVEDLPASLSAADVHVVSLGDRMVGIVHPCKIYGAMNVGRPILFFGPRPSHVSDILDEYPIGQQVAHGDVNGATQAIEKFLDMPVDQLREMGATAHRALTARFTQPYLCGQFCDALERSLGMTPSLMASPSETSTTIGSPDANSDTAPAAASSASDRARV